MKQQPSHAIKKVKKIYWQILFLLMLSLPLSGFLVVNYFAEKVIFFKYGSQRWAMQRPGLCSPTRLKYVFADMRPGHDTQKSLEITCPQARGWPAKSEFIRTVDGLPIHMRTFASTAAQQPLLLYVPGITSSWLDGAKYAPLAKRLGFQLVTFELRNHGISGNNAQGATFGCKEKEDVLVVLRTLQKRYPDRPMYVWTTSMGAMSFLNASETVSNEFPQIKAVVLENLPTSLREVIEESFSPGKPKLLYEAVISWASIRSGVNYRTCSPVSKGAELRIPAFVTVSEHDTLTPPTMVKRFFESLPTDRGHQFKGYPHGMHAAIWNGQPREYEADLLAFWKKHAL